MNEEFGESYSEVLRRDLHLQELDDRTADQAIADGDNPKDVWLAICKTQQVPKSRWTGKPVVKKNRDTQ